MTCVECGGELLAESALCDYCLRDGLGQYPRARPGTLGANWLCKLDAIEFCVRVGRAAGLVARTEVGTPTPYLRRGRPTDGRIDVVWFCPISDIAFYSIEVEGRDVTLDSIRNDVAKFASMGAPNNAIVLFQVDNDLASAKNPAPGSATATGRVERELASLGFVGVQVLLDSGIFSAEAAERWIDSTRALYASWSGSRHHRRLTTDEGLADIVRSMSDEERALMRRRILQTIHHNEAVVVSLGLPCGSVSVRGAGLPSPQRVVRCDTELFEQAITADVAIEVEVEIEFSWGEYDEHEVIRAFVGPANRSFPVARKSEHVVAYLEVDFLLGVPDCGWVVLPDLRRIRRNGGEMVELQP
jgi:hypothetical protein